MPDLFLYAQAALASILASSLCVLFLTRRSGRQRGGIGTDHPTIDSANSTGDPQSDRLLSSVNQFSGPFVGFRVASAGLVAMAVGLIAGYYWLRLRIVWPPVNALQRFLLLILPAAIVIEFAAAFCSRLEHRKSRLVWTLRGILSAMVGPVLVYGSVYLDASSAPWRSGQTLLILGIGPLLLLTMWVLMVRLTQQRGGLSIALALTVTLQVTGLVVMLEGYVSGGAAAIPVAASLIGATCALAVWTRLSATPALIGLSTVSLFGLLFVGRYFGGLETGPALLLFVSPLLCWISECPGLRGRPAVLIAVVRLMVVAIPLLIVLQQARENFNRDTRPLMGLRVPVNSVGLAPSGSTAFARLATDCNATSTGPET